MTNTKNSPRPQLAELFWIKKLGDSTLLYSETVSQNTKRI